MTSRENLHQLIDAVPETRLPALEQILLTTSGPRPVTPRRFTSAGAVSAEHDLAERSVAIVHEDCAEDVIDVDPG